MKMTSKKKKILEKVISNLNSKKDGYCRITQKKGWLGFLQDGDLVFSPNEFRHVLEPIIKEHPPEGEKLFHLRKRYQFTAKSDMTPDVSEAALERFIVASNSEEDFFNQIPIGGRRECIDIGIRESIDKFIFVELKTWGSNDTPLYAILESLKNLMEYRFMLNNPDKYKNIPTYKEIDLIVLAPRFYYEAYKRNESSGIQKMKKALNDISVEFNTNISLMELQIEKRKFDKIREEMKIDDQGRSRVSGADAIHELAWNQWKPLVSSDRKY